MASDIGDIYIISLCICICIICICICICISIYLYICIYVYQINNVPKTSNYQVWIGVTPSIPGDRATWIQLWSVFSAALVDSAPVWLGSIFPSSKPPSVGIHPSTIQRYPIQRYPIRLCSRRHREKKYPIPIDSPHTSINDHLLYVFFSISQGIERMQIGSTFTNVGSGNNIGPYRPSVAPKHLHSQVTKKSRK